MATGQPDFACTQGQLGYAQACPQALWGQGWQPAEYETANCSSPTQHQPTSKHFRFVPQPRQQLKPVAAASSRGQASAPPAHSLCPAVEWCHKSLNCVQHCEAWKAGQSRWPAQASLCRAMHVKIQLHHTCRSSDTQAGKSSPHKRAQRFNNVTTAHTDYAPHRRCSLTRLCAVQGL